MKKINEENNKNNSILMAFWERIIHLIFVF